jgi:hypothetical protein
VAFCNRTPTKDLIKKRKILEGTYYKIDQLLCALQVQQVTNTQEIAAMKAQIIDINNQITTINNNCCP